MTMALRYFLVPFLFSMQVWSAQSVMPELVSLGINPQVKKITTERLQKLREKEDQYVLQIQLGKLTSAQFEQVKALYGNSSQVSYHKDRSYDLVDFLPPVIQATAARHFQVVSYDLSQLAQPEYESDEFNELWAVKKNGIGFFSNCWNTTIEILKFLKNPTANQDYNITWPSRDLADGYLKDDSYSQKVDGKDAKFGDALLVSMAPGGNADVALLQHSALVINSFLVFEKTDSSENDAYRISLKSDVIKKYKKVFEGDEVFEYRRYTGPMPTMEIPPESFSAKTEEILKAANPAIPFGHLTFGCDVAFGGGCEPMVTEYRRVKVGIDPKTQRGVLVGPKLVTDLLIPVY